MAQANEAARIAARHLRRQGWTVTSIAERLGVPASSVSGWCQGVEITAEQRRAIRRAASAARIRAWAQQRREKHRDLRRQWQAEGAALAREHIGDPLMTAGAMLYWAEGKKHRNNLVFANTDPRMVALFLRFLRERMGVPDAKILLTVHCHHNTDRTEAEAYWAGVCGVLPSAIRRGTDDPRPARRPNRRNRHPHGVCSVLVHDTRVLQRIYGMIREMAARM